MTSEQKQYTLGEVLNLLRRKHNFTVDDIADATGYSSRTISRYEKNVTTPTIDYIVRFSYEIQVSIDEIIAISDFRNCH